MIKVARFSLAGLLLLSLVLSCGDDATEPVNRPPNTPSNPSPEDGATNQSVNVDLSWQCSDPDGDPLTYIIAIVGEDMHIIADSNLTQPSYDPGQLHSGVRYGWAVVAMDTHADTATSAVWTFTTASGPPNNPPSEPSSPSPADGATQQSTEVQLSWSCSDPDGDDLTYDVYFGTSSPPPLAQSDQTPTSYDPGTLQTNMTYYWQIVADDGVDQTQGPEWSFSTVSPGVHLIGSYNTPEWGNAIWLEGNYAYIGDGLGGLLIVNVANPSNPTFVGSYDTPSLAKGLQKAGNYVYLADGNSGLQIINVSNPANPLLAGSYSVSWRTDALFVRDDYVYLPERDSVMWILDVTTPSSPSLAGSFLTGDQSRAVYVLGNYAYIANYNSGLLIADVSNPASPSFVGEVNLPDEAHELFVLNNYAYVAAYYAGLQIVDVSNPSSPSIVGAYDTPEETWNVLVEDNYAYLAAGEGGFNILDVSNPASPTLVGGYATTGVRDVAKDDNYLYVVNGSSLLILQFIP
jgi:hypothetical protein